MVFLGAGDAFSAGGRHQAGYLVTAPAATILLDCGGTTLASLKREGIKTGSIDTVLISHLHGDHFSGLPFLFLEYTYVDPRRRPLRIAGPPGTAERVGSLFRSMYQETAAQPLPFPLEFIEMHPQRQLGLDAVTVTPFRVPHQANEISLGFGITVDGRRILYSGDTGWTEDLVSHAQGTDLFICECSFYETRMPSHLDYPRIAANRCRIDTKRLILTHLGQEVLARRNQIDIELASDGLVVGL